MILSMIVCALLSFFDTYPDEAGQTVEHLAAGRAHIDSCLTGLDETERTMALAVVAPEMSLYSRMLDFVELRTLFTLYVTTGKGNFSVGPFQMKPSFIEELHRRVDADPALASYRRLLRCDAEGIARRREILRRLSSMDWQLKYLAAFMAVARPIARESADESEEDALRRIATLYNGGLHLTPAAVRRLQARRQFPRYGRTHNYSEAALEFYRALRPRPRP